MNQLKIAHIKRLKKIKEDDTLTDEQKEMFSNLSHEFMMESADVLASNGALERLPLSPEALEMLSRF